MLTALATLVNVVSEVPSKSRASPHHGSLLACNCRAGNTFGPRLRNQLAWTHTHRLLVYDLAKKPSEVFVRWQRVGINCSFVEMNSTFEENLNGP